MAILNKLCHFFNQNHENSIEFWKCPSHLKWRFYKDVDTDFKSFNLTPSYPCKISWDYCKKLDSDDIINQWKMTFQALDGKGKHFLDLVDNNFDTIEPAYTKGRQTMFTSLWPLQFTMHSSYKSYYQPLPY